MSIPLTEHSGLAVQRKGAASALVQAAALAVSPFISVGVPDIDGSNSASSDISSDCEARSWTEQQVAVWLANIGTTYADAK